MNALLHTIETDLKSGLSYFEKEALVAGLYLWNTLKAAFIALEPAETELLMVLLQSVVASLGAGKSIEETYTAALNTATGDEKNILLKAGSGIVQTIIAGLRVTIPT